MSKFIGKAKAGLMADECGEGQGMAEYALILVGVAVACIAVYKLLGTKITAVVTSINGNLAS